MLAEKATFPEEVINFLINLFMRHEAGLYKCEVRLRNMLMREGISNSGL